MVDLGAANTYLGLRVGLTVSAGAAPVVISMAVLRLGKRHNIRDDDAVQTAASAGEALAGGLMGVLFTIPLRRLLVVEEELAHSVYRSTLVRNPLIRLRAPVIPSARSA